MKRAAIVALIAGICFGLFYGCGEPKPATKRKYDITIWHKDGTVEEIKDADSYIRYSDNAVNVKKGKNKYYYISTDFRLIEH